MAYETIVVETNDHVCLIRLNRPEALNALNSQLIGEVADAVAEADADKAVRCIVLTGSEKAFAAGADISEMADKGYVDVFMGDMFGSQIDRILACRKPIIAAVAGYALGGGCELAMMADFIIAADSAKFGQPEINLGVIAGIGGTQRLTHFVGKSKAMEMHLTGRFMDAEEAERSGLVRRVVPAKKLMDEAMAYAEKLASGPTEAFGDIKAVLDASLDNDLAAQLDLEKETQRKRGNHPNFTEGVTAFMEKRAPNFSR